MFVKGTVTGGHYGIEKVTGGYSRNVSFDVRITSTTRYHCAKPAAGSKLTDLPQVKGDLDSMGFAACGKQLQWNASHRGSWCT